MNNIEEDIIKLIHDSNYFSNELKKKYILAMFLMDYDEQNKFLDLLKTFIYRCKLMDRGIFIVKPDERDKVMKSYKEVKEDLIKKINLDTK